jgi:riboflavin synthase
MFTGLVSDVGTILAAEGDRKVLRRYRIATRYDVASIAIGASIACSGICLTAVERGTADGTGWFDVQCAAETLARTLAGAWRIGTRLNLERSLRIGDELGGHFVSGHVDGLAAIEARRPILAGGEETIEFGLRAPAGLARFIAAKGSVALDGVSLTVNSVDGDQFTVLIIPHTLRETALGAWQAGGQCHIEVDMLARYAARLAEARQSGY